MAVSAAASRVTGKPAHAPPDFSHIFVAHPEEIVESVALGADMGYNRLYCPRQPPPDSWLLTKQFPEGHKAFHELVQAWKNQSSLSSEV